jgi:hypothetical protein
MPVLLADVAREEDGGVMGAPSRPMVGKLVVPYMVDATRKPIDFRELDQDHVDRCAKHRRCGVCGKRIKGGQPVALIGPDDGRTCFADPWMHLSCADLAAVQCPFIRGQRDWRDVDIRSDPMLATYSFGMGTFIAADARAHRGTGGEWHFEAIGELARR